MAREKKEDPPKGSPAWMSTFSDLMNLLLCFFVLLFSMSSVNEEKMEMIVQSFQNTFSVLPSGGTTVKQEGSLISSGISALEQFDVYFNASTAQTGDERNQGNNADSAQSNVGDAGLAQGIEHSGETDTSEATEMTKEEAAKKLEEEGLKESEQIAENIEAMMGQFGIQDMVEVDFNGQYVVLTLNGALLFEPGKAEVKEEGLPLIDKLSQILQTYSTNMIQVEGHTDNVPMSSATYENNDVLSMYRALYVADYIRDHTSLAPSHIVSAGRGEYRPIADNSTAEGRARNRRVEIKVFNSLNSYDID